MRSLQTELIEKGFYKPRKKRVAKKNTRTKDKQSEKLTDREWRELMGEYRSTYSRGKGGAFRQR